MKKYFILSLAFVIFLCLLTSCGDNDELSFKTLSVDGTNAYGEVANETTSFSFIDEITTSRNRKFIVTKDQAGTHVVTTKTISLNVGNNTVYVTLMKNDEPIMVYKVTIYRNPMIKVSFDTSGGNKIDDLMVEKGNLATPPTDVKKTGYTFAGWDYDFTQPITESITVKAKWTPNTDTRYTVEYYLENANNANYSLQERVHLTGVTGATAKAEIKQYEHFSLSSSYSNKTAGEIKADGSLCLKLYYNRERFTVSFDNIGGEVDKTGLYKYGASITLSAKSYLGYSFDGWYCGNLLVTASASTTLTIDKNIRAVFSVNPEMTPFIFTSDFSSCKIDGLSDDSAKELTIPGYVTSISSNAFSGNKNLEKMTMTSGIKSIGSYAFSNCTKLNSVSIPSSVILLCEGAFYGCSALTEITVPNSVETLYPKVFMGCSSLQSITVPFIGESRDDKYNDNIGHIFGGTSLYNSEEIPESLIRITITDATVIPDSAFSKCSNIKEITIQGSATLVGTSAFYGCSSLISISLPNQITTIGDGAFQACTSLVKATIPTSTKTIGNYVFSGCTELVDIEIPENVEIIGSSLLYGCEKVTEIKVADGNTNFKSVDGVLFSADETKIIQYPLGNARTEYTIPASVEFINYCAFSGVDNLTKITFAKTNGWWVSSSATATSGLGILESNLANDALKQISDRYDKHYWHRTV